MIDEQTDKQRSSFWKELPVLLGVAILVAVLVRAFVLQTFFIPSPSMENTLQIDDRVLVNKLVYDFRAPHRGEVIVFKAPTEWSGNPEGEDFIKRVIGVGGDHVICCDAGKLVINGKRLDEPYLYPGNKPADQDFDITVPQGRLWVMGDHREASGDSLEHWQQSGHDMTSATIPEDEVVGRAFTIFWPVNRATWLTVPEQFAAIPNP
ncbi:signal peptidase I [Micromonospora rhizosphaerae]|uniref:Signal peptidase I n=1 Tax=Micromonospora rhizosphaerae TaxID=568872 RepID=A0A1C6RWC9_9ACTN|nr:signal peptidase I [Micromonospora rhizosphaerae]SCL21349.1 signal peptidase I [Micromonospora rhizosphaerae]